MDDCVKRCDLILVEYMAQVPVQNYAYWLDRVNQNGDDIYFVPHKYLKPELCLAAINQNASAIQSMPQTEELCMAAVKKDGMVLGYLDDLDKTPEICREAVKQNREAIQFVPPELRDQVLQLIAIREIIK